MFFVFRVCRYYWFFAIRSFVLSPIPFGFMRRTACLDIHGISAILVSLDCFCACDEIPWVLHASALEGLSAKAKIMDVPAIS